MLWAQFQPRNDAEAAGFMVGTVIGTLIAGAICGAIPLCTGLAMRRPTLGIIGGIIAAATGALIGCCLGLPVAMFITGGIAVVAAVMPVSEPRIAAPPLADDVNYDDYARPFQLPDRAAERPGSLSERDRDRRHEDRYGFRPRRRPADADE